jgi:hypothetical protein
MSTTMTFPPHIERLPKADRASARLRYIVQYAMLQAWNEINIKRLANMAGYDHSSVASAFARGYMTQAMADGFQQALGRKHLRSEDLIAPLDVENTKSPD